MYHMNPNTGDIGQCHAQSMQTCPYYGIEEHSNHYANASNAHKDMEQRFNTKFGLFGLGKGKRSEKKFEEQLSAFKDIQKHLDFDSLVSYSNEKRFHFQILNKTIEDRITSHRFLAYAERDRTAEMLEASMKSDFYNDFVHPYDTENLGNTFKVHPGMELDPEIINRSLSATEIGKLATYDFDPRSDYDKPKYVKDNYRKLVESRKYLREVYDEIIEKDLSNKHGSMYRGIIWERKIRNDFAIDHPELTVYECDGQFRSIDEPWQNGLVDGLVSNREDRVPNGILEIKTSSNADSWIKGIPQNYRAQALYYLHMTGFEYAYLRAVINETHVKEYVLHRNDPVSPDYGANMDMYIDQKVKPWVFKFHPTEERPEHVSYKDSKYENDGDDDNDPDSSTNTEKKAQEDRVNSSRSGAYNGNNRGSYNNRGNGRYYSTNRDNNTDAPKAPAKKKPLPQID